MMTFVQPESESFIHKSITPDGRVGYRQDGNGLWAENKDREGQFNRSYSPLRDVRRMTCAICKKGWEATHQSLTDQTHLSSQDKFVHQTCYLGHLNLREHSLIYNAILSEPLNAAPLHIEEIPNGYGGGYDTSWYRITFKYLSEISIVFGSRRRVWEIKFEGLKFLSFDPKFIEAFKKEDVTKEGGNPDYGDHFLIHAWTEEKVKEYLEVFKKTVMIERALKALKYDGQFNDKDYKVRDQKKIRHYKITSMSVGADGNVKTLAYPDYGSDKKEPFEVIFKLEQLVAAAHAGEIEANYHYENR